MPNKGKLLDRKANDLTNDSFSHYFLYLNQVPDGFHSACACGWFSPTCLTQKAAIHEIQDHLFLNWTQLKNHLHTKWVLLDTTVAVMCNCGWYRYDRDSDTAFDRWTKHKKYCLETRGR